MAKEKEEKKLFLLDAMALIYRAYFAFSNNHRVNSKGQNTSAVFGFTTTLLRMLKQESPTHIAVVFDTPEPTTRHEVYEDYKANREEIPEDLAAAIPYVEKLCEAFNIPVLAMAGYEADDLIGTLARMAEKKGFTTFMMTPDKDYGQLVDKNTYIYKPPRGGGSAEVMGEREVCDRWEIERIDQVIDILGLMGDKVDNIPGIPGVGEKTAIKLVKAYGSIENLYKHTDDLKGKLKEKVENNKDQALQSKMLATIITDVPIKFNEKELVLKPVDPVRVRALFAELEFRTLEKQVLAGGNGAPPVNTEPVQQSMFGSFDGDEVEGVESTPGFKNIHSVPHQYHTAGTPASRRKLAAMLAKKKLVCFDTETTGVDAHTAELVGISFAVKPFEAWYVPVPEGRKEALEILEEFVPVFRNEKITKVGQNIKYDLVVLQHYDVEIKGPLFDTMIAHFLIRPEMRHNMDILAETYLQYAPVSIETLIGKKGKGQLSMRDVPVGEAAAYAAEDADVTLQLQMQFKPMLKESGVQKLFDEVEIPLIPVLASMEKEGIRLDGDALNDLSGKLGRDIRRAEGQIRKMAGTDFNISSPKQVGQVLFDQLKIMDKPPKTKTGQYSTAEDVLTKIESRHPIIKKILDYRELVKLKNTYVDVLPQLVNQKTGRIHTSYNQVVAVTGRLSSDNPNLQNIPIRTERGREIRKAFIPRSAKYVLLSADYSQVELRIIASLSGDKGMISAFKSGADIHAATASKVYEVDMENVTAEMRRNAKMVNFGIIYGISAFGLAERLNIPRGEAREIIDNYFAQYPGIKSYMDQSIENARKKGYVETLLGRRRYLRDINSANATVRGFAERNAINAPIQGSAADMIKVAMINIHHDLAKKKVTSRMLLQVHDELVFDVARNELEDVTKLVEKHMKTAMKLDVPLDVGMGSGKNWLEAH